jgi:GSH-dependent disulfide-bond oxidoreductase
VLGKQLDGRDFIAGSEYTIADMAAYLWIVPYENQGMKLEDFPHLKRWFERIRDREATRRAYAIADTIEGRTDLRTDQEARRHLFGR